MISLICGIQNDQIHRSREQNGDCHWVSGGGSDGQSVLFQLR